MLRIILIVMLMSCPPIRSQTLEFGKISKAELEEKFYPLDSTANAATLFSEQKIHFEYKNGFNVVKEYITRIKIYNREAYQKAIKKIISYHSNGKHEIITGIKASTYNLEGKEIIKSDLRKENIYKEELDDYHKIYKFTMPNLQPGCIVEWKYKVISPFIGSLNVKLQDDIPIKQIKAKITLPEFFVYSTKIRGYLHIPIKKEISSQSVGYIGSVYTGNSYQKTMDSFEYQEIIRQIEMNNIPAIKKELFSGNINNYKAGIRMELSSIRYPNRPFNNLSTDWKTVVKELYSNSYFGNQLKKKKHFTKDLDRVLEDKTSINEKINTIYQFVKSKIKWNNYKHYYTHKGVIKSYKKGVGNVADINLNLVSMLRQAGLNANPVLVSTVDHGIPLFPTKYGFNYVIAHVKTQNGYVLLDATDKNSLPNVLPERVLNFKGRLVFDDGTSDWVELYPSKHAIKKTVINAKFLENTLKGTARKTITNNFLLNYRNELQNKSKDALLEWLDEEYKGIEITNARVSNLDKLGKDGIETIQFETDSYLEEIANKTYLSPLLYTQVTENPFKSEKREFPVFFNYPRASINEIHINIPDVYTIESLPETAEFALPENIGFYQYSVTQNGQNLIITSKLVFNEPVVLPNYYTALKDFYKKVIEQQAKKIVLVK